MSTSPHGRLKEPPLSRRRTPNSNTGAVRNAELPLPNSAESSSVGSILGSEGQNYADSKQREMPSFIQDDTLRQRRNIPGKKSIAGENDEKGKFYDTSTMAPPKLPSSTSSSHTSIDVNASTSEMSLGTVAEKMRLLSTLTAQAEQLRKEQETHQHRAHGLRDKIKAAELACGRMTQHVLEAQERIRQLTLTVMETREAIVTRKRHIKEDEEQLSRELQSRERKMEEVMLIVSEVNRIALETSTETSIAHRTHSQDSK